jgi:hypothetical protein
MKHTRLYNVMWSVVVVCAGLSHIPVHAAAVPEGSRGRGVTIHMAHDELVPRGLGLDRRVTVAVPQNLNQGLAWAVQNDGNILIVQRGEAGAETLVVADDNGMKQFARHGLTSVCQGRR